MEWELTAVPHLARPIISAVLLVQPRHFNVHRPPPQPNSPKCRKLCRIYSTKYGLFADLAPRPLVSLAAMGYTIPALFGAMPPVTIKPTPPMALSAKKAASLERPPPPSGAR